jgi:hypothetical protein
MAVGVGERIPGSLVEAIQVICESDFSAVVETEAIQREEVTRGPGGKRQAKHRMIGGQLSRTSWYAAVVQEDASYSGERSSNSESGPVLTCAL